MKKDNKGEDMAEFKFVKRENELETITKSLSDYNLVMFKSMDKSGLSHFLKKQCNCYGMKILCVFTLMESLIYHYLNK